MICVIRNNYHQNYLLLFRNYIVGTMIQLTCRVLKTSIESMAENIDLS